MSETEEDSRRHLRNLQSLDGLWKKKRGKIRVDDVEDDVEEDVEGEDCNRNREIELMLLRCCCRC